MKTCSIDFETRSPVDLRTRGAFVYFAHPLTKPLLSSYRIDHGPVRRWRYGQPCPADLRAAVEAGAIISAHNASFETGCFDLLADREGWPRPAYEQYRCTAATAAAMALPRDLETLAMALGLTTQKDKEGTRLIRKFSIPRRPRKHEDPDGLYWNEPEDHPEDFDRFCAYCDTDVTVEDEADARMMRLSDAEQQLWLLDQTINRRGIRIDIASAAAALELAEKAKTLLDAEMREITGGVVRKCSEPGRLVQWIQDQGVELTSAAKAELTDLMEVEDLPPAVRRAVEVRQEAAKTSVQKLSAMLKRASADGRVRGSFLFCGASTGRWSNTGVNFANMPRPRREFDDAHLDRRDLFQAIRTASPDYLRLAYGDTLGRPLHLVSDAIRGFVWAAPGHDLVQADYSGIEGAVIAWSSDEAWKVQALHEIMADPSLPDLYRRTAAAIMNLTTDIVTKKHPLRQSVGKVSELALGYGGGVAAFYSMSRNYGVNLDGLYEPVWGAADEERREKAVRRYLACLKRGTSKTDSLSREAWIACELIKVGWRASNPAISGGWRLREDAVREAIREPGRQVSTLKFSYVVARGFLWCRLPSGRCLAYGSPKLKDQVWVEVRLDDGSWSDAEVMDREAAEAGERKGAVRVKGATAPRITALGVNSVTRKWERFGLYGGLLAENDTQAVARDLMVNGLLRAEAAGYPVIAHVYDEIIAEVPKGFGDLRDFERLICELPPWAAGLPLSAGGWRGKRYRKD